MKSTSFLHHFGHSLYHCYIKIGGFYIISTPAKNPPAKSLHRLYIIISGFYTIPTPKSEESTSFLHHPGIQCTHRCGHPIWCFMWKSKNHIISTPFLHHTYIVFSIFISFLYRWKFSWLQTLYRYYIIFPISTSLLYRNGRVLYQFYITEGS